MEGIQVITTVEYLNSLMKEINQKNKIIAAMAEHLCYTCVKVIKDITPWDTQQDIINKFTKQVEEK